MQAQQGHQVPSQPTKRSTTAEERMTVLRSKMDLANSKGEKAIQDYNDHRAKLLRRNPTESAFKIAKRDDQLLAELAGAVEHHTATATRHAATLAVELLALLVRTLKGQP